MHRDFKTLIKGVVMYLISSVVVIGFIASFYSWLVLSPTYTYSSVGCNSDGEGSWSIGIFYGDSPFSLKPIEKRNVSRNESSAWPVANPVLTCATPSDAGFPSNFVADPFLFIQGDSLYLFFETKNAITMKGDIAVARSEDGGASWKYLGVALSEDWHLSYPYVFRFDNQVYMMPEGSRRGDLRVYRAVDFPLRWSLDKIMIRKPMVDSTVVNYNGKYWLFGSDFSRLGAVKNGEMEIWYSESSSPLGPWKPHKKNPIYNVGRGFGARNAGRPFVYKGKLYRSGQDCGETYGRRVRVFEVQVLTVDDYREVEVPFEKEESGKGRNAWDGARYHHLDAQMLPSGKWIAVMDGDRVPSGDFVLRLFKGYLALATLVVLVTSVGFSIGAVRYILFLGRCLPISKKRTDTIAPAKSSSSFKLIRWLWAYSNRMRCFFEGKMNPNTCARRSVFAVIVLTGVTLACIATHYIYGGNGAEEPYPVNGQYSQFTLLTMTYDARLWNLKMFVSHYSKCSSVREIVVVWNKGVPPVLSDLNSVVPVRIRIEPKNSLNNRFKVDPLIETRAVLELDDDIMMRCDDLERGFRVWRLHPERIVGFYPRLADGTPFLEYRDKRYARRRNQYNMILTGAAFLDQKSAFSKYWSKEAEPGRKIVDGSFNCEDVLLNYLYTNSSTGLTTPVEYVRPAWAIDMSKFSGVAISRNTEEHYKIRSECLNKFSEMYGNLGRRTLEFGRRIDGWDL